MNTPWTDKVDKKLPLPEYPRPQMVRENWINLNGYWNYAINKSSRRPINFDGEIVVPFSPESELSEVNRKLEKDEYLWYQRSIRIPKSFVGKRVLLHFGAVDNDATVWIGDNLCTRHVGGYLPFSTDITDFISGESICITVRVKDETDFSYHSRGKQKSKRGGIWYTPQSGIWQTVWMEAVSSSYIDNLIIKPNFDEKTVYVEAKVIGNATAFALFNGDKYKLPCDIKVDDFIPWSPDTPQLYYFKVVCGNDEVISYFAMRKYSIDIDKNGNKVFYLNNKQLFHNGLLDQGYWPDGLYTAPCDDALIFDIASAKNMGFNVLRKHIKVEPLRWYYHCDRLGMIVWQDMINGGSKYSLAVVSAPLFTNIHIKDNKYRLFARKDEEGRKEYKSELKQLIDHLYNAPCVAMWVLFNEGWGQFDSSNMLNYAISLDNTRYIDHASGWHDQGVGAIKSWHVYFREYKFKKDKYNRCVILSEFGGYIYKVDGHTYNDKQFGYKKIETMHGVEYALNDLFQRQILNAKNNGLAASIYTQLSDVEDELNGLITYDRKVFKIPIDSIKEIVSI